MNYKDPYMHLRNPKIFSILVGHDKFEMYFFKGYRDVINISMPAMTKGAVFGIGKKYGVDLSSKYILNPSDSVTGYLDIVISRCIERKCGSELLAYLFGKAYIVNDGAK